MNNQEPVIISERKILIGKLRKAYQEKQEIVLRLSDGTKSEAGYILIMYGDVAFRFASSTPPPSSQDRSIFVVLADIKDVSLASSALGLWR
ncbi:MAG: hypothetical protein ACOYXT_27655 [Bacteroidota bacterium]